MKTKNCSCSDNLKKELSELVKKWHGENCNQWRIMSEIIKRIEELIQNPEHL